MRFKSMTQWAAQEEEGKPSGESGSLEVWGEALLVGKNSFPNVEDVMVGLLLQEKLEIVIPDMDLQQTKPLYLPGALFSVKKRPTRPLQVPC